MPSQETPAHASIGSALSPHPIHGHLLPCSKATVPCLALLLWPSLLKTFGKPADLTMIPQLGGSRRPWYKRGGRLHGLSVSSFLFSRVSVLTCVFVFFLQVFLPLDFSFPRLALVCIHNPFCNHRLVHCVTSTVSNNHLINPRTIFPVSFLALQL